MGAVYARADRVLAWLGAHDHDSALAMDAMRNLSLSALRDDDAHLAAEVASQMADGECLRGIVSLVQREYWRRAWYVFLGSSSLLFIAFFFFLLFLVPGSRVIRVLRQQLGLPLLSRPAYTPPLELSMQTEPTELGLQLTDTPGQDHPRDHRALCLARVPPRARRVVR
jgi:hypothetical protein